MTWLAEPELGWAVKASWVASWPRPLPSSPQADIASVAASAMSARCMTSSDRVAVRLPTPLVRPGCSTVSWRTGLAGWALRDGYGPEIREGTEVVKGDRRAGQPTPEGVGQGFKCGLGEPARVRAVGL